MSRFKSSFVYATAALSFLACLAPSLSLAAEEGRSEATNTRESPTSGRIIRRVIFEGSLTNAGYEGGQASRYSKANGYAAGALFDLLGGGNLVLETGLLYRQIGTSVDNGVNHDDFTGHYLSVPASLKYYFSGQEHTSIYIKGGVMGSTLVSGNQIYTTPTSKIGARSWETSFLAGLGLKLDLSPMTGIVAEADYNRAVDSIFPDSNIYRSDFSGTLGLALNL